MQLLKCFDNLWKTQMYTVILLLFGIFVIEYFRNICVCAFGPIFVKNSLLRPVEPLVLITQTRASVASSFSMH